MIIPVRTNIWICRDGRRMRIQEMETSHLLNSVAMIRRRNGWRWEYLDLLLKELKRREVQLPDLTT
jgi:hypothetical protein